MLLTVSVAFGGIAVGLVTWLARMLRANGSLFLEEVFAGCEQLAGAADRPLVTSLAADRPLLDRLLTFGPGPKVCTP